MIVDYKNYTAENLLRDPYFIHTMRHPTHESAEFWRKLIEEGAILEEEFDFARQYLLAVSVKRENMSKLELQALHEKIKTDTILQKPRGKSVYYSAVATILFLLTISFSVYLYRLSDQDNIVRMASSMQKPVTSEHVELIFSDNERIAIEEDSILIDYAGDNVITINAKVVDKVVEDKKESTIQQYNQLVVPYGKSSKLILEDGTCIWINAGTRVVYPVNFEKNRREIYVDGEIFMEVTKDTQRPFHVRSSNLDVVVLGTSFNVMAYEKDSVQSVVLVNGSVEVKSKGSKKPVTLVPDRMMSRKQNGEIQVKQVNVTDYISWKDGMYIFNHENLQNIALRLSRYYNVTITTDEKAAKLFCNGKLDLKDDLRNVLQVLVSTAPVDCLMRKEKEYNLMFNPLK